MIGMLLKAFGLKFLAKKIAKIVLEKLVYKEVRAMVAKSENTVDDEIAEAVIQQLDKALDAI